MTSRVCIIGLLFVIHADYLPAQQSLHEQVGKHGSLELLVLNEYSPVNLETLAKEVPVIAHVLITEAKSFVDGERVWTDYSAQILAVTKGEQALQGKILTVRRPGGLVLVDEKTVNSRDPDFPAFDLQEEYVLFLKPTSEEHFVIPFGAQGAFRIQQGRVAQVSRDTGTWNKERGSVGLGAFLNEIDQVARKPKQ
jgi:hypothetical protein